MAAGNRNKTYNIDEEVSQHVFAGIVGTSPATVGRLVGTVLPRGGTLKVWIRAWCRYLADKEKKDEIALQRARLLKAQADRAELERDEKRGTLGNREAAVLAWSELVRKCRERLLQIPRTVAAQVPINIRDEVQELIRKYLYEALNELSKGDKW